MMVSRIEGSASWPRIRAATRPSESAVDAGTQSRRLRDHGRRPARRDGWHYDVCRGGVLADFPDAEVEVGAATRNGGAVLMVVVTIVIGRTVYVLSAETAVGATTPLFVVARGE